MEIITDKIENIIAKSEYEYKEEYSDDILNMFFNYWSFFNENEKEIQDVLKESLDTIMYSKYYWCNKFKIRYNELYGNDEGISQNQFKIIEEITQRCNDVNWVLIKAIEEGNI